ncbi:Predicted integral membrane protein [Halobiforma haloterrestris]|uniref:Predicted integral membrane protein n=1 Tax=Natronobacterium haloterrestre TaxID=148448 RepID=A0A1I1JUD1_NATHA|nr:DUF2270 domain-containing protein [Halobiforma haloterrestris]SFC52269.1 Predicted integral membrane protein [Halobiforma haloterrestris]
MGDGEDDFEPERRAEREVAGDLADERTEFVGLMQHLYRGELGRVTAWRALLADDLREPTLKVPLLEALSRRLRRVYFALITVIVVSWVFRITVFSPDPIDVREAATIDPIPGNVVIVGIAVFYLIVLGVTIWPIDRLAMGEKREPPEPPEGWRKK